MIPSILCLCYVLPSVELLGPATTSFQTRTHDPPFSTKIDASGVCSGFLCDYCKFSELNTWNCKFIIIHRILNYQCNKL